MSRFPAWTPEEDAWLARLRAKGMFVVQIAEQMGRLARDIENRCAELGIPSEVRMGALQKAGESWRFNEQRIREDAINGSAKLLTAMERFYANREARRA